MQHAMSQHNIQLFEKHQIHKSASKTNECNRKYLAKKCVVSSVVPALIVHSQLRNEKRRLRRQQFRGPDQIHDEVCMCAGTKIAQIFSKISHLVYVLVRVSISE